MTAPAAVSRETDANDFASPANRRRQPRERVEHRGRWAKVGPAWTKEEVALLRRLVEAGCVNRDIATHFNSTPSAIAALMNRHRIVRRHPTVAEVLASETPRPAGSASVAAPHPEPVEGQAQASEPAIPTVILFDRYERYEGRVELHEIDGHGRARVRMALDGGRAGKWLTVPVLLLRFDRSQDRAALIAQARERHAATQSRRAALHAASTNGEPDHV